jgi:hypothetical protein
VEGIKIFMRLKMSKQKFRQNHGKLHGDIKGMFG